MKKNILRSCLISPIIIGAFLSSGQVFADENAATPATTVTENVQTSVEQSDSPQLNNDTVTSDANETSSSLVSSEDQSESQKLIDASNQGSAFTNSQESDKVVNDNTSLINPSISEEKEETVETSKGDVLTSSPDSQKTDSQLADDTSKEDAAAVINDSKVSTSNVQAVSQKYSINWLHQK